MKKEDKTLRTKKKILQAAITEFGRNGYSGGSINAICASGINKGLIYHNFKSKDELYLACVKQTIDDMSESIERQLDDPSVSYSAARMNFFAENEMEARIFLEITVDPSEKLAGQIRALRQPLEEINKREFNKLLEKQTMRKDISLHAAFRWFSAMQDFYNLEFKKFSQEATGFSKRLALHEQGAAEFIDMMLYGIAVHTEDGK